MSWPTRVIYGIELVVHNVCLTAGKQYIILSSTKPECVLKTNSPTHGEACLTMAANHLGNPNDTPARTLNALKTADLLVCEEHKSARQLLKQAKTTKDYLLYNEHGQKGSLDNIGQAFKDGKTVVYVSDQGCPTLADPGRAIVELAYHHKVPIKVIPGPSSVPAAISACPFDLSSFFFAGFLPAESRRRREKLQYLARKHREPLVILDTPYRLKALLETTEQVFGSKQQVMLAQNCTMADETYHCGNVGLLAGTIDEKVRKNFVLIIAGR